MAKFSQGLYVQIRDRAVKNGTKYDVFAFF